MKKLVFIIIFALILSAACTNTNQIKLRENMQKEEKKDNVTNEITNNQENKELTDEDEWLRNKQKINIKADKYNIELSPNINTIKTYEVKIPNDIIENYKYTKYDTLKNYILILSESANIRQQPDVKSDVIKKVKRNDKIGVLEEVKMYNQKTSSSWYKVYWLENDQKKYGYISSKLAEVREFQFEKMKQAIDKMSLATKDIKMAYISNYKDKNGQSPLYNGRTTDLYGIRRYQSAPAYDEPNTNSTFRYIADGALVCILGEISNFYKIRAFNFEGEYYIPKKYITFNNTIKEISKAIVVDRKNQNEAVYEYTDNKWNIVSYTYATTGAKAKYKLPTDLGYYMIMDKRDRFIYFDDVSGVIVGYAPHAIRFSGGAYIHGVPVEYKKENNKLIDPGILEYLDTIGTIPRSHKCVRNYTSHAKFLYDWAEIGKTVVIVIE